MSHEISIDSEPSSLNSSFNANDIQVDNFVQVFTNGPFVQRNRYLSIIEENDIDNNLIENDIDNDYLETDLINETDEQFYNFVKLNNSYCQDEFITTLNELNQIETEYHKENEVEEILTNDIFQPDCFTKNTQGFSGCNVKKENHDLNETSYWNDSNCLSLSYENSTSNTTNHLQYATRLLDDDVREICPSCKMYFDKSKKRKLIDACGHTRCYSCMFRDERCPICNDCKLQDYESGIGGSSSTIVSPFGSPRPQIKFQNWLNETSTKTFKMQNKQGSLKTTSEKTSILVTPQARRKFFNSKITKAATEKSIRRNNFNESVKTLSKDLEGGGGGNNLLEISTCSDSVVTKRRKSTSPFRNLSGFNLDNKSNRLSLVGAGQLSSLVFGKIKSLWNAQSCSINAGLNQLAGTQMNQGDLQGKVTFLSENIDDFKLQNSYFETEEHKTNLTESSEYQISQMLQKQNIETETFHSSNNLVNDFKINSKNIIKGSSHSIGNTRKLVRNCAKNEHLKNGETKHKFVVRNTIQLNLKPLFFEVPLQEPDPIFIGRQWLLREISNILTTTETSGVLISGNPGTGKTALILQLVEFSCFGRKKNSIAPENDGIYCQINVGHERIRALSSYVVAYHFCQAENNSTCLVADFIHSLAAQLCQTSQLAAYREYLETEQHLQHFLSIKECCADPERVMRIAILEPLIYLKTSGKISSKCCIILIDALCEAEYHRPDQGFTIATFLSKVLKFFPSWLKVISTLRTHMKEYIKGLPFSNVTLNAEPSNDFIQKDILDYIAFRINHSSNIQRNIGPNRETNTAQYKLINHIITLTKGSFLFCKLLLDLIEKGNLVIKSSSYKILPVSLAQIYLLNFNIRFPTISSFEKAMPILNVCLASLYPLPLNEIFYAISALSTEKYMDWNEFLERFKLLNEFLVQRLDKTYMFFHPSFREWLIRRDDGESTKFLCDFRMGHVALAFRLSRTELSLDPEQTLEFCHHILKAHIFKNCQPSLSPRDIQSYWITITTDAISSALCTLRNTYSPNIKVSRLLLLAGASPDFYTEFLGHATILCIAAHEGIVPMVSLLLEFGANVSKTNSQGCTPLILAAMKGHCDVVRLLIAAGSDISQTDITQRCALVHASRNGKLNVVKYLLACQWPFHNSLLSQNQVSFEFALQQSLIAAASYDHASIVEDLLDLDNVNINGIDQQSGETALTIASQNGCIESIVILLARGAEVDAKNNQQSSALLLSIRAGHLSITERLLTNNSNIEQTEQFTKKSPLIIAAEEGHINIIKILLEKSIDLEAEDNEGLTALSWACLRGRYIIVKILIENNCSTTHEDNAGRSLLDLAAYQGSADLIQLLLEHGLKIEHVDKNGMRPLDRAIACRNVQVVQIFLRKGAKLGPATWTMATGKVEIFVILVNKLLEDGNVLYKQKKYYDAAHRYQYALKKVSSKEILCERNYIFNQLRVNLLLNLSRSKRKINELPESIDLATQAIELQPGNYEGYYARAKAKLERNYINEACADAKHALDKSQNAKQEVKEILERFYDEIFTRVSKSKIKFSNEVTDL